MGVRMIPYAGKTKYTSSSFHKVAMVSLQSQNQALNKELYKLRSEKILVERELLRARARIEELERAIACVNNVVSKFDEPTLATFVGVEDVVHATASYYGLGSETIRGDSRQREVLLARHVAMYLANGLSRTSTVAIGRHLGGRDHTTVGSGIRRIQRIIQNDPGLLQDITQIKLKLQNAPSGASEAVPSLSSPVGERAASLPPMVGHDGSAGDSNNA